MKGLICTYKKGIQHWREETREKKGKKTEWNKIS
jgi:hypothetical protein